MRLETESYEGLPLSSSVAREILVVAPEPHLIGREVCGELVYGVDVQDALGLPTDRLHTQTVTGLSVLRNPCEVTHDINITIIKCCSLT